MGRYRILSQDDARHGRTRRLRRSQPRILSPRVRTPPTKGLGEILLAEYEGKPLAALFVARNGNRAYYLYGASTDEERNRMPTYLLQWEAMKWAKARGCEEYDLWGVPDEDEATLEANFETRHDGLWGVYRFKRGFGGELKRAVQALDRVYNPLLYWAYLKFIGSRGE
ncbi:MAG: peptidoglycan bridge formation glycyltransferase FemA/FemB family protein [Anaerolineales bacterium]